MSKDDRQKKADEVAKRVQKDRSPTRTRHGTPRPGPSRGGGKEGGPPRPKKDSK